LGIDGPHILNPLPVTVKICFDGNRNHGDAGPGRQLDPQGIKRLHVKFHAPGSLGKYNDRPTVGNKFVALAQHHFKIFARIFPRNSDHSQCSENRSENRIVTQFFLDNEINIAKGQRDTGQYERFHQTHMIANVNHRSLMRGYALQSRNIDVTTNGFDNLKAPVRIHGPQGAVQTASAGRKSRMKERISKPEVIQQT